MNSIKYLFLFLLSTTTFLSTLNAQWEEVPGFGGEPVREIYQNSQWVFAVQNNGLFYRSNDEGANWELLNGADFENVKSIAVSEDLLFIHADFKFLKSYDNGDSWTALDPFVNLPGGARKLVIHEGEIFSAQFGKVNKVDIDAGTTTQLISTIDNSLSFYPNGNQLWVSFGQIGTKMTEDGGQTWVDYPNFYNLDIAFADGKAFGCRNSQPHNDMQYYEIGNPTPTTVALPLSPNTGPPSALFELDGDIIAVWGKQIAYRYMINSDTWEVFESPSDEFSITAGFRRGNTLMFAFDEGVMAKLDGSPHWYNRSQGLRHIQKITLRTKEGMLHCSNLKNSFFRTADNPNWNTTPFYTPGALQPYIHRIVKHGDYYYSDDYYRILRSADGITWEELCPRPSTISGDVIASGDSLWVLARPFTSAIFKVYHSSDNGANWVQGETLPYGSKENAGHYFKQFGQDLYSFNDGRKLYQLNKTTQKVDIKATIPGSSDSEASILSISGNEMVINDRFHGVRYSSNGGLDWALFDPERADGSDLYHQNIIVTPGGLVIQNSREVFKSIGPGFPFIKMPLPYLDSLPSNTNIKINSMIDFEEWLYIGLSNGLIYRTPLPDLSKTEYSGRVYLDENKNGVFDGVDQPIPGLMVNRGPYKVAATDSLGRYRIDDIQVENFISVNIPWADWESNPQQYQTAIPDTIYDFALVPPNLGNFCISSTISRWFVPGFTNRYNLDISNIGPAGDAIVKLLPDTALVEVLGFSIDPDYYLGDTLVWELNDFQILESRRIYVTLRTLPEALFEPFIHMYGEVQSPQGDAYTSNNVFDRYHPVRSSYDPNDKQVDNEKPLRNEDLTYTIRFQNTGNIPTSFITIRDTLSDHLDLRTAQILATSHPVQLEVADTNILHFVYDPIYLADSISNEPESHGYVKFKISPRPDLPYGTVIENAVGIYFDFNPVVLTNTVTSIVSKPTSSDSMALSFCEGEVYQGIVLSSDTVLIDTTEMADEIIYTYIFLTVNGETYSETIATICENESYLWNNNSFTQPGSYILVMPNEAGCDSILTLQLTQLPLSPDTTVLLTIAEGEEILGIPIYTDTILVDSLVNEVGCDSVVFLEIMVLTHTENLLSEQGIQFFPNPVEDQLFIDWQNSKAIVESVELVSMDGKVVLSQRNTHRLQRVYFDTKGLPAGMYYCQLKTTAGILVKKTIVR